MGDALSKTIVTLSSCGSIVERAISNAVGFSEASDNSGFRRRTQTPFGIKMASAGPPNDSPPPDIVITIGFSSIDVDSVFRESTVAKGRELQGKKYHFRVLANRTSKWSY